MRKKVSSIVLNVFLLLLGIVTVYPFIWMLCSSFKQNKEIMALQQHLLPQEFTIDNYISMNSHFNFMRFFGNSLFITIVVTLLVVYTSTICGFVLSKYKFKGRNILFGFVLATMMIPWCVTIIPKYTMIQKFGWMHLHMIQMAAYMKMLSGREHRYFRTSQSKASEAGGETRQRYFSSMVSVAYGMI